VKAGWKVKTLGEVCTLQRGFDLPTTQRTAGIYPLVTSSGASDTHSEYKVEGPGVVTGRSGSIGRVYYVEDHFWPLNTALYVKDFHGNDPKFVWYLLQYFDLSRFSTGAGVPTLNRNDVHGEAVHAPNSTAEQKRIVEVLDAAFEGLTRARAHTETNLQNARELFESFLGDFFSGDGKGWSSEQLTNVVSDDCTLSYGIVQPGEEVADGLCVVRPTDLGPRVITAKGLKRIDPKLAASYRRTTLQGNELLLCVRGTTGTVAIASQELAGANVTRGIVPIRFDHAKITQELGYYLFRSGGVQEQIRAGTYGAALMQINIGDLRKIVVNFPPLKEQKQHLSELAAAEKYCDDLQSHYRAKLADLDALRQALLQKAFAGELT
jgi:type I restriction enzyme S subunit